MPAQWAQTGTAHPQAGSAFQALGQDAKVVLYCGSGSRSALAADSLMKMGYSNVFSLAGGLGAYKSAGLPTEKPAT